LCFGGHVIKASEYNITIIVPVILSTIGIFASDENDSLMSEYTVRMALNFYLKRQGLLL